MAEQRDDRWDIRFSTRSRTRVAALGTKPSARSGRRREEHLCKGGAQVTRLSNGVEAVDPWGTRVRLIQA